ncbi:DUF1295 domain-containing protein [Candidatus Gracilibacteria bacterium]|nr:DUF1295 domain-containing protein [Candidatus Gracilibacteria bacterium]
MIEIILVISLCLLGLFLLSIKLQDNSIIDAFWGLGFVIIALLSYFLQSNFKTAQTILTLLVTAWGVRLFLLFLSKKLPYEGKEDKRYARWREKWTYFYTRSFFQVYVLQGVLMFLVAIPILLINFESNFQENMLLTIFGALLAVFGLIYETKADAELSGFIVNKKSGDILTEGLRKFHRYPQYFGESVFWLGISIISLQVSILGVVGWIVITILVRFVSGVPLLEERYKGQKNYEEYSKKTSIFIPNYFT